MTNNFTGARAFLCYELKLSVDSKFTSELELLDSLKDTSDLRAKWVTAVTGKLTAALALKASYTVLYDHKPVEVVVPGAGGAPDAVFVYNTTDTILATSLVWTF